LLFLQVFEKQKSEKTKELEHAAELASTRRCTEAGMDHIREMLNDNDIWLRHCLMGRPYMDSVNKTKVFDVSTF